MSQNSHTNRLIHESSPYLLQHSHNPVDWYPWGEEALTKAKQENKLILVSIGYAACHWCHVMEKETFEDEEAARVMNENFVCIKVDREERPDIDQIYMDAVQLMSGQGGWPLNCFAAPDGSPVYGGTYFPKHQWIQLLDQLSDLYKTDPEKVNEAARKMKKGIKDYHVISAASGEPEFKMEVVDGLARNWKRIFDPEYGGNNYAPKFPTPVNYLFLLRYYYYSRDKDILTHLERTLKNMANGGIYDQAGGGFCRYSTDRYWKVPHFEKMLYDNAQLLSLYSESYRLTGAEQYKSIIEETIDFLCRELKDESGMFYSSLDADSEGVEGKFYVWTYQEFIDVIDGVGKKEFLAEYFNVKKQGNWEGNNILFIDKDVSELCEKHGINEATAKNQIKKAKEALMERRNSRIRPGLDDKIITSWNALLISGLAESFKALKKEEYLNLALACGKNMKDKMWVNDELYRIHKSGKTTVKAFLEDYACLILSMCDLYEITLDESWLTFGHALLKRALAAFYDEENGFFIFNPHKEEDLFSRKMDISDTVIPSSNALMAKCLVKYGKYFENLDYLTISKKMVSSMEPKLSKSGTEFTMWAALYLGMIKEPYEVAILSENAVELSRKIHAEYFPGISLAASNKKSSLPLLKDRYVEGKSQFYLCRNNVCSKPVETLNEALELLEKSRN